MGHISADRVFDTTTTTGTGNVTLANSAPSTWGTFGSVCANNDTFFYGIRHRTANEWEVGFGTYVSATPAVARTSVIRSSNSNSAVNFSAGTKDVFICRPGHVFGGMISPTDAANVNDWAPSGLASAAEIRWNGAGSIVVTGLTGGYDARLIKISNITADRMLCLAHENTGSSAANRFSNLFLGRGTHVLLPPGRSAWFTYSSASSRWVLDETSYSPSLQNRYRVYRGQVPGSGTAPQAFGIPHTSGGGTISHPGPATTNFATSRQRVRGATGTTAGTQSGTRGSANFVLRGNAAGIGGFHARFIWGKNTNTSGGSEFVGLFNSAAPGNANADSLLNQVGFQRNPAETTWRIGSNDGSGSATRTDLGANYSVTTTSQVFEGHLWAAPNGSAILYAIWRLDNLTVIPVVGSLTTDLPTNTNFLTTHVWCCNRADAATIETEWELIEVGTP